MKAKLVLWSPMVRVIVEDDASHEDIIAAAKNKFSDVLKYEYENHIEDVLDDKECPYVPEYDELTKTI